MTKHRRPRKKTKIVGGVLLALGFDTLTPPYPSSDALYVLPFFLLFWKLANLGPIMSIGTLFWYIITCVIVGLLMMGTGTILLLC